MKACAGGPEIDCFDCFHSILGILIPSVINIVLAMNNIFGRGDG